MLSMYFKKDKILNCFFSIPYQFPVFWQFLFLYNDLIFLSLSCVIAGKNMNGKEGD